MIKINFALRRSQLGVGQKHEKSLGFIDSFVNQVGGSGFLSVMRSFSSDRESPLRRAGLPAVVCIFATFMLETYKDDELKKVDIEMARVISAGVSFKAKIDKMPEYEAQQRELDQDIQLIRTKIQVIRKIVGDRTNSPKFLSVLASSIPSDVWLSDIRVEQGTIVLKGAAVGFNQISDFIKNLKSNAFFAGIELKSTQQERQEGIEVAAFELHGTRRSSE